MAALQALWRFLAIILVASTWILPIKLAHGWTSSPGVHRVSATPRSVASSCPTTLLYQTLQPSEDEGGAALEDDFYVRDGLFGDLGTVADVIISSFYVNATSPWKQLYRMAELNRLQQAFPFADKELHRMLVAVATTEKGRERVVGFCDIDARIPNQKTSYTYNPRPYLSDLAVDPLYRRRGIARALIETSEEFCIQSMQREQVFIRVEAKNQAALDMYQGMQYSTVDNPDDPLGLILLLNKKFNAAVPAEELQGVRD